MKLLRIKSIFKAVIVIFVAGCTNPLGDSKGHVDSSYNPGVPSDSLIIAPSAPVLTLAVTQASRVDLAWSANSGSNPVTYIVRRSTTSGADYADVTGCIGLSTTVCNDSSVTAGTTYYYIVVATNSGGSASSNEVSAAPMAAFTISLTPGKGLVQASFVSTGATSYNLQYGSSTGVYTTTINGATSPTVISGLNFGTTYYFMVTAINAAGSITASSEVSGSPNEPWLSDYLYRQKITINNSGVTQSMAGVPILIELPSTFNYAATHIDQSGKDLRFTASDKQTPLPYYFEKWVYGSRSQIWVRTANIPASGAAAEIFIYYGKINANDGQNEPAVWDQSNGLRLHADDSNSYPNILESVSGTFGTATAGVTSVSGLLSQALHFDGLAYNVTTHPFNTQIATNRTTSITRTSIGMWIKPETGTANGFRRIAASDAGYFGLSSAEVLNVAFYDTTPTLSADLRGRTVTDSTSDGGSSGPWQFIATTWDQTDLDPTLDGGATTFETRSFFNGSLDMAWMNQLSSAIATSAPNWLIGNRADGSRPYKGALDKLIIRESLDSDDYFGIHYASVRGFEARIGVSQVSNSTAYSITINGTPFTFTSDASATTAEILSGLAKLINAGAEPVSAGQTRSYIWINPDNPSSTFSLSISNRLSHVVRSTFDRNVVVAVGSVANSTSYTITINGSNFNYVSDADATEVEIRSGLLAAISGGTFPISAVDSGSNIEFSLIKPTSLTLSNSVNLTAAADGNDRLLTINAVQNSTLYRVTVGGINADYTSGASATSLQIRNGLVQAINTLSETNGASASIESSQVRVKPATPREFSIATSTNLSLSKTITPFTAFSSAENW